jgi:hypothetical protein
MLSASHRLNTSRASVASQAALAESLAAARRKHREVEARDKMVSQLSL